MTPIKGSRCASVRIPAWEDPARQERCYFLWPRSCRSLRVATSRGEEVKFAATMWVIGILFLGAAAAGRAIKILGNDLPALKSRFARIGLALVGAAALALGAVYIVNSVHEPTALVPGGTTASPLVETPATSTPVTITNTPEVTNVAPIEQPPAVVPAPDKPVTIINAMPGATNASSTANPPPVPADSSAVKETTYGTIQNTNGLCMDLTSDREGAQVLMEPCRGPGYTPQLWKVYHDYTIQNYNSMCMTEAGPMVMVATCYSEPEYVHQKWNWMSNGDFTIRNANGLCMDLMSDQPDTRVSVVPCQPNRASQKWHWYMPH